MALPERLQVILELKADQYKREVRSVTSATGKIGSSAKSAGSATGKMEQSVNKLGSSTRRLQAPLARVGPGLIAAFGAQKVLSGISDAVSRAEELNSIYAITEKVIEKTGGAANLTTEEIKKLSKEQSLLTGVDKALVQEGNNILLTFKNIRNEVGEGNQVFERTSALMLDVGAVMGTDARSGAVQLGKALNDPIANLSALSRAGLTFTQTQKDGIKALVESGDLLSAQKIILSELESQLGGTAEASADATAKIGNAFKEVQEEFGQVFLEVIEDLAPTLIELAPLLGDVAREVAEVAAQALKVVGPLAEVVKFLDKVGIETDESGERFSLWSLITKGSVFSVIDAVKLMVDGVDESTEATEESARAAADADRVLRNKFNPSLEETGTFAERGAAKLEELQTQIRSLVDPAFAALNALDKFRDSQLSLNEAIDEYGVHSQEAEEAGRDVLDSYGDLVAAAREYADVSGQDLIASIVELGNQAGVPAEVISQIVQALGELDGFVATATVKVNAPPSLQNLAGLNIGPRQHGGSHSAGQLLRVGEANRPELLMIPGDRGQVFSNQDVKALIAAFQAAAVGGRRETNFTFNNSMLANDPRQAVRSALAFDSLGNL